MVYGGFDEFRTHNAVSVLYGCIVKYGKPLELLLDHGNQSKQIQVKFKQMQ